MTKPASAPRTAVFVGPYSSGKTTLLESVLFAAGAVNRKGSIKEGNTVGDSQPEARARRMTTEPNLAMAEYLGESWCFIDCPGSIELSQDAINAMAVADMAIIVCEPDAAKAVAMSPLFKFLDDHSIPHAVFINKVDAASTGIRDTVEALQSISERPLVLREVPIRDGDAVVGMVDLVSERAFRWNQDKPSEMIQLPETVKEREEEARSALLESLADYDDGLMEKLLEDMTPSTDEVYQNLTVDLSHDLIVPVFFGSAEKGHGITRLLKLLRHEAPEPNAAAERLGIDVDGEARALVFKTLHASSTGKLSLARVFSGEITDGMSLNGSRVSGLYRLTGQNQEKLAKAGLGQVVGLGRMEEVATGMLLSSTAASRLDGWPEPLSPLYSLAVRSEKRGDDVKISGALQKLVEEDPSLSFEHDQETGELVLHGQGEVHLQIALDRLRSRYKLEMTAHRPQVPYRETIRKSTSRHARHKKQSGGHGEFGDVHLTIEPMPRGAGFVFTDQITGGVVPKQYIPAVEKGVRDYLARGPLGFQVVDVKVTLTDGQYHNVDSSDMAFQKAAQLGMREGMPECSPVLLEPICQVAISVPNEFTSKIQRLVSGRRGQIMGFDAKEGWKGWDEVQVQMPQAEMHDLIVDLRSMTIGVGSYTASFDHLQEITGRVADEVVASRKESLAG